jgi:hypothetical protein
MKKTSYAWNPAARVKTNPEQVATELCRIYEAARAAGRDRMTPDEVVVAAKDPGSALHAEFVWDDKKAAEKYRHDRACYLIRNLDIHIVEDTKPGGVVTVLPAFTSVGPGSPVGPREGYLDIRTALTDDDVRAKLLRTIMLELRALKRRYKAYEEFASVWRAIDEVERSFEEKSPEEKPPEESSAGDGEAPAEDRSDEDEEHPDGSS